MIRAPRVDEIARGVGQQVEALLRVEPADHPHDRRRIGRVHPVTGEEVGPAGGLAGLVGRVVAGREVGVRGRVPELVVEAVEDAHEAGRPVAGARLGPLAKEPVEPHPVGRGERLGGEAGADGVGHLRALDPGPQEVDPVGRGGHDAVARGEAQVGQALQAGPSRGRPGCGG